MRTLTFGNETFCAICDHSVEDPLLRVELHRRHEGGGFVCLRCIVQEYRQTVVPRVENAAPPVPWSRTAPPDVWIFATELCHYGNDPSVRHLHAHIELTEDRSQNAFWVWATHAEMRLREEAAAPPGSHAYSERIVVAPTRYVPAKDITDDEAFFAARIIALRADIQKAINKLAQEEPFTDAYQTFRDVLEDALERDATWAVEDAYGEEHQPFDTEDEHAHRRRREEALRAFENDPRESKP